MFSLILMRPRLTAVLLLTTLLASSCAMQEQDLLSRIFPEPTEKTITDVPHMTVDQQLDQESPLRRFRNPQEMADAVGDIVVSGNPAAFQGEQMAQEVLANSFVYRINETGFSYAKLGDGALPVRVMMLPFKPAGIATNNNMLVVTGAKDDATHTFVAYIDITAPAAPRLLSTTEADGALMGLRFEPDTIFIVLRGRWKNMMNIPALYANGQAPQYDYTRAGCACPALYGFTRAYTNPGYVHVLSVNTTNPASFTNQQVIAVSDDQQVALTQNALYIGYAPQLSEDDVLLDVLKTAMQSRLDAKAKLEYTKIVQAPDYVLSAAERRSKELHYLRKEEQTLPKDQYEAVEREVASSQQIAMFRNKAQVTMLHKLRFDAGKLQFVSAAITSGTPFDTISLGETTKGTWLVSRQPGSGAVMHTFDEQLQPQGELKIESMLQPQVRRAKDDTVWLTTAGSNDAHIISLADLTKPAQTGMQTIVDDARLISLEDGRSIQVNKVQNGLTLDLLRTQGDVQKLATLSLTGAAAYSRLFDSLDAAYYMPAKKLLVLHVEEARKVGNADHFDGVMVFAIDDNTIEKRAEFDLRAGMDRLTSGSDISIQPVSDNGVAVLYGKTASLIDLDQLKETVRKVLQ